MQYVIFQFSELSINDNDNRSLIYSLVNLNNVFMFNKHFKGTNTLNLIKLLLYFIHHILDYSLHDKNHPHFFHPVLLWRLYI